MSGKNLITFLTDYGLENKFIGVCHGVMARIAPAARILDVTHLVPRGDVRHGAEVFRQAIPYLPEAVHVSVVDPGVGTSRKAVVLVVGDRLFVGPDNGLLLPAIDEIGTVDAAYELTEPRFHLTPVSHTFHGRDVFSPVAGHLANSVAPAEFGPAVDPATLVRLPQPVRHRDGDTLHAEVMIEDRFGNLQTSLDTALLADIGVQVGDKLMIDGGSGRTVIPYVDTFGSVGEGEPLAHIDSADRLAIAVNLGSAADLLQMHEGDVFELRRT
jgi:S-adenosylmethionine hydrolase